MTFDPTPLLATYVQTKTQACRRGNGPVDVMALLTSQPVGEEGMVVAGLGVPGNPVDVLGLAVLDLRARLGALAWIAFSVDTHVKADDGPPPKPGEYAREFAARADTSVREALMVWWHTADGEHGVTTTTYGFDGPLPTFEPVEQTTKARGAIAEALKLAFW